ncbi:PREDICTED: gamma-aminobutyric acid type B receptor subunit 2-like [Acropora digitifera]|uniref:gamma-aminobutyric acid type B receptor subunit 2-like n=1 Tax=Acropora digitifera TaxID=70779 RepID=UPI00077A0DA8|nr:PREDICTED: gamma-aminobutyric acid type B receptor subunit 2-like [Acropora digitifera]
MRSAIILGFHLAPVSHMIRSILIGLVFCGVSVNSKKDLTIGAYVPLTGSCWRSGFAVKTVIEWALEQVNERNDILFGYQLNVVLNDTKCDPGIGMHILYDHVYNEPTKIMLLGAAFSPVTQPIADTSKYWNLLQVSYSSTSPALKNRELYPRFFRTISTDLAFNPARVELLIKYGWKRIATLHQNEPSGIFSQVRQLYRMAKQIIFLKFFVLSFYPARAHHWATLIFLLHAGSGPPPDRTIKERELKSVSVALFACMAGVAVLGILLGIGFLWINFQYRERRIIKMSSPRLNNVIVAGCIMTYFSVILFGLDGGVVASEKYGQVCTARAWIMCIGFTLAFGAMFTKTWRVHAIFKSISPKKKVIRDEHLLLMVLILVFVDVLYLSLWTGIEPMQTGYLELGEKKRMEDDKEIIPVVQHCESENISYWLGAVYGFKGLLLLFGVFLAWETRGVTIPALNDSKAIGMSVYNVVILSILGVAITSFIKEHQNATFTITAFFTIVCTTLTLFFVFVPKVMMLLSHDGGDEASNTKRSTAINSDSTTSMDKNAVNMTVENSLLKKQLAVCEQHLMELRRLLENLPPESRVHEENSEEDEGKFKKRKSIVQFKPDPSHANESFVPDEEIRNRNRCTGVSTSPARGEWARTH